MKEGNNMGPFKDIAVEKTGHVALIEIRRPPNNFFDIALIQEIAGALEALDADADCRAVVLAAQGKSFCAGANFGDGATLDKDGRRPDELKRQRRCSISISKQSPVPHQETDRRRRAWRRGRRRSRPRHGRGFPRRLPGDALCANFTRLGFHPGFGLTVTLPAVIGPTKAALMFYTSRRVTGEEAHAMGLADVLVPQDQVRAAAMKLAAEIAENSPLGLIATRATMRGDLAERVLKATEHELKEQTGCARPRISRKASRRPPSAGCRTFSGASRYAAQDPEHPCGHGGDFQACPGI